MKLVLRNVVCALVLGLLLFGGLPALALEKADINTATVQQLIEIKGVGDVLAQRIVDYRELHKEFKSLDELNSVKGIGSKKLEKLLPYLTLVKK